MIHKHSVKQVEIDFEGGLTDQYPEWQDMLVQTVSGSRRQQKAIAADLDMSPSELSRKIQYNPNDNVEFPLRRFADLIIATEDFSPIYWLIEKFLEDSDRKKKDAVNQLIRLVPEIQKILQEVNAE